MRDAAPDEVELLARIAAASFYDDPVMGWIFPDSTARLDQLRTVFIGFAHGYFPDRGVVHVIGDACASFWRRPDFDHRPGAADASDESGPPGTEAETEPSPFPPDIVDRLGVLSAAMEAAHPHEPHWYLNVLSTVPERQGQGLGSKAMRAVLTQCDAGGIPAYLESTNPRNMALYERHGFRQTDEVPLADGPSIYPMWRDPR